MLGGALGTLFSIGVRPIHIHRLTDCDCRASWRVYQDQSVSRLVNRYSPAAASARKRPFSKRARVIPD